MEKIESAVADQNITETAEKYAFELSLDELDFVGGGGSASVNV